MSAKRWRVMGQLGVIALTTITIACTETSTVGVRYRVTQLGEAGASSPARITFTSDSGTEVLDLPNLPWVSGVHQMPVGASVRLTAEVPGRFPDGNLQCEILDESGTTFESVPARRCAVSGTLPLYP
jgi:hypothetical protein